ncbi:MAG: electron transfer flavoprotein subunit alpha/FixB family protein [bacterium]|nr:electron transfer flavoprotein subunit alpha/FixB family protein [bacterium]
MIENKDVLIFGEMADGKLSSVVHELLGIGRKLADERNEQLWLVLIDKNAGIVAREAFGRGADKVIIVDDAPMDTYEGASCAAIMEKILVETVKPAILILGQTLTGRDLAPRLAFKFDCGLAMDCTGLSIDPGTRNLVANKSVAGGNILATYSMKDSRIQIATVRRKSMAPLEPDNCREGETLTISAGIDASAVKAKLIDTVLESGEGPDLESAEIIVTGGRGVGTPEEFEAHITNGLAKVLGAAVGGTRAAVDFGLVPEQNQVGLTGKIVGPNLYFAVALSGAIQHITGCIGSKIIVAINKDENAQIFNFARFGIVGDYKKILPPLVEKLTLVSAE